ncbi:MAG: hypothetical protein EXR79_12790 [Myxococcales bacterium]|nr:hypothetical protein [Myxococcales bacterium]
MSERTRRHHSPEQKATLVKGHLIAKVPVSQLCNENELQPSLCDDWLRLFQMHAHAAFVAPVPSSRERQFEAKVAALEAGLAFTLRQYRPWSRPPRPGADRACVRALGPGTAGRRPVLILARTRACTYLARITVAEVTSTIRGIPQEVSVGPRDGLSHDCAVNLDSVHAAPPAG